MLSLASCFMLVIVAAEPSPTAVTLKTVKYVELGDAIKQLKGKVVVVDFWADFCIPCKKEFPHLVAMHKKYPADGFAAISVALDDVNNKGVTERILKFLQDKKAAFPNFLLDEKPEFWQEKLQFDGPPCVYVFNQEGIVAKQFKDDFSYADVEKLVKELLGKK